MTRVTLGPGPIDRLRSIPADLFDVCHPRGYVVGTFSPGMTWDDVLASTPPLDDEADFDEGPDGETFSTAEVLEYLNSIAPLTEPREGEHLMSRVVLESSALQKLLAENKPVEVCNEAGEVVGLFSPHFNPDDYENLEPQISDEELVRRLNSKGPRYSTAEVLRRLESL